MKQRAFSVISTLAKRTSPVVFASPHSGSEYDSAFLKASILDDQQIRSSEDAFVDLAFFRGSTIRRTLCYAQPNRARFSISTGQWKSWIRR